MAKQEFNGKTLDEALSAAARAFGTDVNLLSYNILPQNSGGLFSKLFQRGVRLEAWIDSSNDVQAAAREAVRQARADAQSDQTTKGPRQQQAGRPARGEDTRPKQGQRKNNADAPRPRNQDQQNGKHARPQTSGASARTAQLDLPVKRRVEESESDRAPRNKIDLNSDASKDLLKELAIQFVRGFDPDLDPGTVDIEFGSNEDVTVTVQSPNLESFLIRTDRLSCAFEHLFKRIAQRRFGDVSGRITLNAGSANQQREEKLKQLALDVASKVKENGKTITLSSKSSQERRVIHLALEHMDGIATKSIGVGENRKLVIYSTTRPPREKGNRRHSTHGQRQHDGSPRHQSLESKSNNQITDADGKVSFANQQGESGERTPPRRNRRRGRRGGSRPQQLRSDDRSADEGPKAVVKDTPHQPPHENEV